jgi:Xaa-Pro aminopeptidase
MDYSGRQSRLAALLREQGLDSVLVTHLPNIRYLCGFTGSAGVLAISAAGKARKAAFFTDGRYTQQASEEVDGAKVVISKTAAIVGAVEWLKRQSKLKSVGVEAEHMSVATRASLGKYAGSIRLQPTSGLIEGLRAVKEKAEIEQIRSAVELASRVFDAVRTNIRPGAQESAIAAEIEYMSRRLGAEGMSFDTLVAAGKRSALPHGVASQNPLPKRGFVILDFGVILGGYCSDMTRTVYLGQPSRAERKMYESVLEAQLAGIKAVTPGAKCAEVDRATRNVLEKAGLGRYFTHSTGHGVGIEIHEMPGIRKAAKPTKGKKRMAARARKSAGAQFDTLVPGMVITIEPGVYIPGEGGVRIEDMVVVTETGCEVLTPTPKEMIVI